MSSGREGFRVGVVGATGAVGERLLSILAERKFPVRELRAFASERSVGKRVPWLDTTVECRGLEAEGFSGLDWVFFDASDAVSKQWVPVALQAGAWVIDNSATYRMDVSVPLLVPEVNGGEWKAKWKPGQKKLIAGPNCSTAQLVMALKPIAVKWGLRRVIVSSYQSTSGAGAAAVEELKRESLALVSNHAIALDGKVFSHQIGFNCIPQIGSFQSDGSTSEEQKIMQETQKILSLENLKISATAVRVPTWYAHAETVNIECERSFEVSNVREEMAAFPGIQVIDEPSRSEYPMGWTHSADLVPGASGRDPVYVGRIRRDPSLENGLNLWIVADNLRKGAALNAVQIAEWVLTHQIN